MFTFTRTGSSVAKGSAVSVHAPEAGTFRHAARVSTIIQLLIVAPGDGNCDRKQLETAASFFVSDRYQQLQVRRTL